MAEMRTVLERKKQIMKELKDGKVRTIVLYGKAGVGKTWTAKEMSNLARRKGLVNIVLWVFLKRGEYDKVSLRDSVARQLSLFHTTGESEVENDKNELEETQGDLKQQQQISAALAGKKLLLVLDDEGNTMNEPLMTELKSLLNLDQQTFKILSTRRNSLSSITSEDTKEIEVKPLTPEESLYLLEQRAGAGVGEVLGIPHFVEMTKCLPAAIFLMAKAFNYFYQQESRVQMLKQSLEEASGNEAYNVTHLLRGGYDLLPNSVLVDCSWGGSHFFRNCRHIHYNELIAYWMMEGYLGHINCMEKAYQRGHQVLKELVDCQILKKVEADYVIMEGPMLNLGEIFMERAIHNLDDSYRRGFGGTASLGLATVFGVGKWDGLGRITLKDGMIKTLPSDKNGQKLSTLLVDGNSLSRDFPRNFFQSHRELQVLALFNPSLNTLSLSSMPNLCMLVLRGCHYMEKIDQVDHFQKFQKLTALEISDPSPLMTIPDEFFEYMPQLQSLNLSALQMDLLPSSVYNLSELSWLILKDCSKLKTLKSLRKMKNLMVLDLSGATSLENTQDKNFFKNKELQVINFSKTKIKILPLLISLRKLTHLLISECLEMGRLRGINAVSTLQVVDLSGAGIFKEFHDQSLEGIVGLKILDLSKTSVANLPSNIGNPHHLSLKGCIQLQNFSFIETLKDLEALDLSKTLVKTLPSLSHLSNLHQLLLSCCSNLEELPELESLKKLEVLDLSGCTALRVIHGKPFEEMTCLWRLDLSETRIESLPSLSNLSNLRHLLLRQCTNLKSIPPLESLSKLEELNLCGVSSLKGNGADFLNQMNHLQILDLSETMLQQLPPISNIKNICQLYLRGCPNLKAVPDFKELTKLEVLDLSGTRVGHVPSFNNLTNLRQLLLRDCPDLQEFRQLGQLEILHLLGATDSELPYGISKLTCLEHLDLPNMKTTYEAGSSMIKEPNQYGWDISSLPAETVGGDLKPPVSVSSSQFLPLLGDNPSLWKKSFKQFHFLIHPIEEQDRKGVVSFWRDDFMFRDIYFQTRYFSDNKEQRSLELRGFNHSPKGIEKVLCHTDSVFLIENAFKSWVSELHASNLKVLKGCWIERCSEMESVSYEGDAEEMVKLGNLEVLWVSNTVNLKHIYCGNWKIDTFQNLKQIYLDCCPKLEIVFSSSQLPKNLQVLQIKFCDELNAVFESGSSELVLPNLHTLYLCELPKLKIIGRALPSLRTGKVWECPNLAEEEKVRLARIL